MSEPVPLRPGAGADAVALVERRARRAELGERAQAGRADAAEALAAELSIRVARLEAQAERGEAGVTRFGRVHELETELQRAWQLAFAEQQRRAELEEELHVALRAVTDERDELHAALDAERERAEGYRARLRALEAEAVRWRRPGEETAHRAGSPPPRRVARRPDRPRGGARRSRSGRGSRPLPAAPRPLAPPSTPRRPSPSPSARSTRPRSTPPAPACAPPRPRARRSREPAARAPAAAARAVALRRRPAPGRDATRRPPARRSSPWPAPTTSPGRARSPTGSS